MLPYEFLDHTADYALRAWGADLSELIANACRGLVALCVEPAGLQPTDELHLEARGEAPETLLVHALREVLYCLEDGYLPLNVRVGSLEDDRVVLVVGAIALAGHESRILAHVKAVTYHDLHIAEVDGGLSAIVVMDA